MNEKKSRKKSLNLRLIVVLLVIIAEITALVMLCIYFIPKIKASDGDSASEITDTLGEEAESLDTPPETPDDITESATLAPEGGGGVLCFVFDDAGHNLFHLEPFLNLPFPCTIAVLPALSHSAESAKQIREAGKEVILHQPMQAVNLSINPGPSAIMPDMEEEEIKSIVSANLDEIWPVSGLNNHEGSLITRDARSMEAVFDVIEERSIFFLDSKTIGNTAAPEIAAKRGIKILERSVFIDNSQEREEIIAAVLQGAKIASNSGYAVLIGHVWSEDLAGILTELYPTLTDAGHKFSNLSSLLASSND